MTPGELEGLAEALFDLAGVADHETVTPASVARRAAGATVIRVPHLLATGTLSLVNGQPVIAVRRGLDPIRERHVIGHELGHWILRREGVPVDDYTEAACDYIGAALLTRRAAFARALRDRLTLPELAARFEVTETLAALREAEVTGRPRAVVAPGSVRVRGQLEFVWPDEGTLRRWATGRAAPGVAKVRLRDDPRRVLLEPAEDTG